MLYHKVFIVRQMQYLPSAKIKIYCICCFTVGVVDLVAKGYLSFLHLISLPAWRNTKPFTSFLSFLVNSN